MEVLPIDIVALVSVVLGISVVLVPVIGVTARFALKPLVEALARIFESRSVDETVRILERRVELQEQEIDALQSAIDRLNEAHDFDRQLAAPRVEDAAPER